MSKETVSPISLTGHTATQRICPSSDGLLFVTEINNNGKFVLTEILDSEKERREFIKDLNEAPISTLCQIMDNPVYKPDAFVEWKKQHHITPTLITEIKAGDVIVFQGEVKTVGEEYIKHDGFMGTTLYGDNFRNGVKLVNLIKPEDIPKFKQANNNVL